MANGHPLHLVGGLRGSDHRRANPGKLHVPLSRIRIGSRECVPPSSSPTATAYPSLHVEALWMDDDRGTRGAIESPRVSTTTVTASDDGSWLPANNDRPRSLWQRTDLLARWRQRRPGPARSTTCLDGSGLEREYSVRDCQSNC